MRRTVTQRSAKAPSRMSSAVGSHVRADGVDRDEALVAQRRAAAGHLRAPRAPRPPSTKSIASVTMMSATRVTTIDQAGEGADAAPPTSDDRDARRAAPRRSSCGACTSRRRRWRAHIIEPTERSIPPEMITIACAQAANASGSASIASDCTSNGPHCHGRRRAPVEGDQDEQQHGDADRPAVAAHEARATSSSRVGVAVVPAVVGCVTRRLALAERPCIASQQRRLVGRRAGQLGGDPAAEERQHAVADERELGQLAREEEDRGAVVGEPAQERVDLALRADVDAARRVEAEHRR